MRRLFRRAILLTLSAAALAFAPTALAQEQQSGSDDPFQALLTQHADVIAKSSRRTVGEAIDAIVQSEAPQAATFLLRWQLKEVWRHKEDGYFVYADVIDRSTFQAFDPVTDADLGVLEDSPFKQVKPNSGVRGMLGAALVQFQLSDPDPTIRMGALDAIGRDAEPSHLFALRSAIENEGDPAIKTQKERLERLLTIQFAESDDERIEAIQGFEGDLGIDVRAALTPLAQTEIAFAPVAEDTSDTLVETLTPGGDALSATDAYSLLVEADLAPAVISLEAQKQALIDNIVDGSVGGVDVAALDNQAARDAAYAALVAQGLAPVVPSVNDIATSLADYTFYTQYSAAPAPVAKHAARTLASIESTLGVNQLFDLSLDALSLASIYFLAAIGLAITFGVMRVINMAHGEFIMMGAYTGFVVQQFIPNYTTSVIVALPLAFAITFAAGVALERLVIRWLAHRPLETLLATFGISIALQQLAKNIFGTQARPLTSPSWLDGSLIFNDVVSISYIRIAIFVMALLLLGLFIFVMKRTRLGLEVRAVSQNPRMASSMGINPGRINMLTFGFGSGIAGIAGVAIGLYAKVTSEMGADYIVQSFMTVVVGGVGNIWGTLLGASMVGSLQKVIEWFTPSNTLAAQTYMILFIILFIQFRPKGIIALKGRAAEA